MMDMAKRAGEEAALSAFGLAHGTPRPPPTWAQEWQRSPRKTGTQAVTIPSMLEKKAFEPISLGLGLLGAGGKALGAHVLSNVGAKAVRRWAPSVGQSNFASGLSHGLSGRQLHPATERVIRTGLGPEALVNYQMARQLGIHLRSMPPEQQKAYLQKIQQFASESPHVKGQALASAAAGGIERYLKGDTGWMNRGLRGKGKLFGLSNVAETGKPTAMHPLEYAAGPAVALAGGLTGGVLPGLAGDVGLNSLVNTIRQRVGHSALGKRLFAKQFTEGAKGKTISEPHKWFNDLIISPAYNDPRNMGLAINKEYTRTSDAMNKLIQQHGGHPVQLPSAEQAVTFGENVVNRVNAQKAPPPAPAAPQGPQAAPGGLPPGMMTKGLLLGGGMLALRNALQPDSAVEQQPY